MEEIKSGFSREMELAINSAFSLSRRVGPGSIFPEIEPEKENDSENPE